MQPAVTFDFHNTLIRCDPWFELEVKTLPVEVARRLRGADKWTAHGPDDAELISTYRTLRAEIIEHGEEMDSAQGVSETFRRIGVTVGAQAIAPIVDELFDALVAHSCVVEGARETLSHLREMDIRIGVVSSAVHHDFLESVLHHHGLRKYLDVVVTSASSGYYKSRPEIYEIAFESLGAGTAGSAHVGDSFRFDHLAGKRAGLQTVWLNEGGQAPPAGEPEPTLTIDSLVGAGPLIHQLLGAPINAR